MNDTLQLNDGRIFLLNDVSFVHHGDNSCCVSFGCRKPDGKWESWKEDFMGDEAVKIMAMVNEFSIDRSDIKPDDIAHIEHKGFGGFGNFLRWFRGESA